MMAMFVRIANIHSLNKLSYFIPSVRLFSESKPISDCLKLVTAAQSIPHPEKKRGEDAFFINDYGFGVADGVGGWREHGVDPGEFSRTLVNNMSNAIKHPVIDKSDLKWKAISAAQATCSAIRMGSSTLCTVAVGTNNKVYFYNIGDSGLYVLRYGIAPPKNGEEKPSSSTKEWFINDFTPKQCHSFNFPFQLGKGADNPANGISDALKVQAGDVCLVASDGLFDNLWPNDLTTLMNTFWKDGFPTDGEKSSKESLQEMVNAIVGVTLKYSCGSTTTPFENDALQNGYKYQGGKPDDITAVLTLFQ